MNKVDHFADKSKNWDLNSKRVQNAKNIADLTMKKIKLNPSMKLMDFGVGTGLLSYFIAPYVSKITAVDNSPSMLVELQVKRNKFACDIEIIEKDLSTQTISHIFDGIISSMTIHHLEDTKMILSKFYEMLDLNGFIALADLDSEDGSFHSDDESVFHNGFNRKKLEILAKEVGFKEITFETASVIKKPHREFSVFLMTATK